MLPRPQIFPKAAKQGRQHASQRQQSHQQAVLLQLTNTHQLLKNKYACAALKAFFEP